MSTYTLCPESASTFQSLLDRAEAGDHFLLAPGVYRGAWRLTRSGAEGKPIVIEAATPGTAVITGADVVIGWEADPEIPGAFRAALDLEALPPSNKYGLLAGRREQVFIDGHPLRQVLNVEDLSPGCFLYKEGLLRMIPAAFTGEFRGGELKVEAGAIVGGGEKILSRHDAENVWPFLLNPFVPAQHVIEATTRCEIFGTGSGRESGTPAHIVVRGLVFRASGDAPQQSMVRFCGQHLLIEDCLFEYGAARGFDLRCDHSVMRRCVTRLNGQMGFSGYGHHNLLEDCALLHNNTKHSSFVCFEQGGSKICRASHWIVRRVRCVGNDGPGIWFDIDNHDNLIEGCWCEGNSGPGIMYEISWDAVIRNNVCVRNGFAYRKDQRFDSIANSVGHLEPVYGQGILVQMSRNVTVHNNTCVGNRRCGIELRHHPYQQAGNEGHSKDTYRLRDNEVFNNLLADNDWNNLMVSEQPLNPVKAGEVLDNHHDNNLFHNSSALLQHGGNLSAYCRWGKTQHAGSMSLEEWRACRHQDLNSIQWDPMFVAPQEGDFRLEPQSPACGRGRPVEGYVADYRGIPRPERPSIGAFEALAPSAADYLTTR